MTAPAVGRPRPIWTPEDAERVAQGRRPGVRAGLVAWEDRVQLRVRAQWAMLAVGAAFMVWRGLMIGSAGDFLKSVLAIWWSLVLLGALGLVAGRTLPMRRLYAYVLLGFFVVPPLTVLLTGPVLARVPYDVGVALVVPIAEEVLKAAPLLLIALAARRDPFGPRSVLDYGLAGFALGGGFWIHEDILWGRSTAVVEGPLSLVAPWLYITGPYFTGSHPGWTALIGLGLGTMLVLRGRRLSWVVAVVAVVVSILEHAGWNYGGTMDLLSWTGHGRIPLLLLVLMLVAALAHGGYVRRWAAGRDDLLPPPQLRIWPWRAGWRRGAGYALVRAQAHLAAWQRDVLGVAQPDRPGAAPLLAHLGRVPDGAAQPAGDPVER